MAPTKPKGLQDQYKMKSDKEHVLDNPDTYIGGVEPTEMILPIAYKDEEGNVKIKEEQIVSNPGLYKLLDEGLVNCRDHAVRMETAIKNGASTCYPVTKIEMEVTEDGKISLLNDGNGIDVAMHPEHNIWIPELVFGHLRTSTNYDKSEKKIVGGKNGFGFKLVLIWSTWGQIETVDSVRGLKYTQTFRDNLSVIEKPSVTKCRSKPYTKVSFLPDYARLQMSSGLTDQMRSLFMRRIYDVAAVTDKSVRVKYNGDLIGVKTFQNYVDLYLGPKEAAPRAYESANERWEYAVALTQKDEYAQVSFVNGIFTAKGGKHVEYITNQIVKKLVALIKKKKKVDVKPATVKEQLMVFVRCDIENPSFDSQTKEFLSTPVVKFGSQCTVSDKFVEKVAKMGVLDTACALTQVKDSQMEKKTDGSKSRTIRGIPKLIDANWAGTDKAGQCTLILCEGDSAKAGIVSGLSREDRDTMGVYPMRGKMLNVRGEAAKRIAENKEIAEIKRILGLESGKKYTETTIKTALRYGNILFMTDQDLDGVHIKGLGINLFQSLWASLTKVLGFIGFMNTPILKATKGKQSMSFYSEGEYEKWKEATDSKGWTVKYYKGLGTSTGKEFREYLESKRVVTLSHGGSDCDDSIDMVFNKKRAEDRKDWLMQYNKDNFLDTEKTEITYNEFVDRELIHFSKYDCDRSIPNMMDGLKTSQRKILYSAFKKGLDKEIKVAQFSGYVSENSGYHHGESSLNGAIVGMAQNFVGSNNINLLQPNGQFGTRLQGGKDSASERYIFTQLSPVTRSLFVKSDEAILEYKDDDGTQVEPFHYAPVIPTILVNGSRGIGTGFSTEIPSYNPIDIINYVRQKLEHPEMTGEIEFTPYYDGFKGSIEQIPDQSGKFVVKGRFEKINERQVRVTELPIGTWTDDFKQHLESLIQPVAPAKGPKPKPLLRDYTDMSTDQHVDIVISFGVGVLSKLMTEKHTYGCNGVEKTLKLYTTISTGNMHVFNDREQLRKYERPQQIIDDFFTVRHSLYAKRREHQLEMLRSEVRHISNKALYINLLLTDAIDLRKKKAHEVEEMLEKNNLDRDDSGNYKYLTRMPMDSVTEENVEKLMLLKGNKEVELSELESSDATTLWLADLNAFAEAYKSHKEQLKITRESEESTSKGSKKKTRRPKLKI